MKARDAIPWLLLAAGAYAIYRMMGALNRSDDKATDALAALWSKLFDPPPIEVLGGVEFPNGAIVPLQQLSNARAIRQDANHNVYVRYQDHVWKLAPSNAAGNWPATMVQ